MRLFRATKVAALVAASLFVGEAAFAQTIVVPSDSRAIYAAVNVKKINKNEVEIITRRHGSSGTSYAKRLVNCSSMTFKYLSEGDTLEDLNKPGPISAMSPLVSGSISDVISRWACENR